MEASLIYTYDLRGALHLLPRLYTFIRSFEGRYTLLDLGRSCVPDAWPCSVTAGRSTLFVLDAMGYTAANVQGVLSAESRRKITGQVALALVDAAHPHHTESLSFVAQPLETDAPQVVLTPAEKTRLDDKTLTLAPVPQGSIGLVRVVEGELREASIHALPEKTAPDATIAGAVDFVESEARYFEKRQSD